MKARILVTAAGVLAIGTAIALHQAPTVRHSEQVVPTSGSVESTPDQTEQAQADTQALAAPQDSAAAPAQGGSGAQPPATQGQAPSAPAPVTPVGDPTLAYVDSTDHPGQQDAYCTYQFSDGTTQIRWTGRRQTPGAGVVKADLECSSW